VTVSRFERLYRDNFPFVWAAARRCGAPDEAVGDVVQDVFVTAHRRLDELSYEVSPRGWLYGVTRRVAFRYRRSAARTARRKAAVAQRVARAVEPHARAEAARELERMLAQIDHDQRHAFVMAELLGMTGPEIAGELGVPLATVYSRLRLAKRRLERVASTPDALEAGVDAARRTQMPPAGEAQRTWAALIPVLGSPLVPVKLAIAAALKSVWVPAALVTAIAIGISSAGDEDPARGSPSPGEPTMAHAIDPEPARVSSTVDASPNASPSPNADVEARAEPTTATATSASRAPGSPRGAAPSTGSEAPSAPAATADDELVLEVEQLERARQALRRGEPERALSLLQDLDRRIEGGQLLDARLAARVRALCASGRAAEAEREAARLHRDHPGSNVALGTPKKCEAP
jgi:RNA polymerase sigma factor (sigma-70 family)